MFRPMIERQLSPIGSLTLLPPIVAITVAERRQPRTWCGPNAYFSTSAPRRASGLASMESTHTSDQASDVLERLGPSWAGLFHNRGQRYQQWPGVCNAFQLLDADATCCRRSTLAGYRRACARIHALRCSVGVQASPYRHNRPEHLNNTQLQTFMHRS